MASPFAAILTQLGPLAVPFEDFAHVDDNPFFVANASIVGELETFMDRLRKSGDSCGARITAIATGVPVGWGEPVYGKLDADLAAAMMGINAVKGVEIGAGFAAIAQKGTEHSDEMTPEGFASNHAGGILGGISTGQDIVVSIAVKPTSSIRLDRHSIDKNGAPCRREHARRRSVRGDPRDADRGGDAGTRVDGPRVATSRAERGRRHDDATYRGPGARRRDRALARRGGRRGPGSGRSVGKPYFTLRIVAPAPPRASVSVTSSSVCSCALSLTISPAAVATIAQPRSSTA